MIGESVTLANYKFQLLKADEFTLRFMRENPEIFPECDLTKILDKLKSKSKNFNSHEEYAIQFLKALDKSNRGYIEFVDLYDGLKGLGVNLNIHEIYTLIRHFEKNNNFKIGTDELYNAIFKSKKNW